MNPIAEIVIRSILSFSILLVLARILGKKQVSQLTYFNYVTGITFGSIAGILAVDRTTTIGEGLTALLVWACATLLVGYIALKSRKARVLFDGEPTLVIRHGKILEKAMAKTRLNLDDLTMMLRQNKVFQIADVDYAILEPNGTLSVLLHPGKQPASKQDVHVNTTPVVHLSNIVISDGVVVEQNLQQLNLDRNWLHGQLEAQGITDLRSVFFAEVQTDGQLHVNQYQEQVH